MFYINHIRTGKGLIFYPVYKLPKWLATASWMLRNAGVLQVREQGLYDLSNISSKSVSNFSTPTPKDGTRGGKMHPRMHCIAFQEMRLNSWSRSQAFIMGSKFLCFALRDPLDALLSRAAHPCNLSGESRTRHQCCYSPMESYLQQKVVLFFEKEVMVKVVLLGLWKDTNRMYVGIYTVYYIYCILYIVYCICYISCITYHISQLQDEEKKMSLFKSPGILSQQPELIQYFCA